MRIHLLIFASILSSSSFLFSNDSISLLKKGEIYLTLPSSISDKYVEYNKKFVTSPFFVVSKKGIVLKVRTGLYSYDERCNLIGRIPMDTTLTRNPFTKPGNFVYYCNSIALSGGKIVATDGARRINIYDHKLNFLRSFAIPYYNVSEHSMLLNDSMLIVSGRFQFHPQRGEYNGISIYNINNGKLLSRFFKTTGEDINRICKKGEVAVSTSLWNYFTLLPNGNLICNRTTDHKIYEYDVKGNLIYTYNEIPPHYIPLDKAEEMNMKTFDSSEDKRDKWWNSWSYSLFPSLWGEDIFIVPRRSCPPYYLDFYSIKKRKYLGFSNLGDRKFLFSDSLYIYLWDDYNDRTLIIGKYEPFILPQVDTTIVLDSIPKEVASLILRGFEEYIVPDTVEIELQDTIKSVKELKVINRDSRKQILMTYLSSEKSHILLFSGLFDCVFPEMYDEALKFVKRNQKNFDLIVIFNHPYPSELIPFVSGVEYIPYDEKAASIAKRIELDAIVLGNTNVKSLRGFGINSIPAYMVLNNKCEVIEVFNILTSPETARQFLNRIKKIR